MDVQQMEGYDELVGKLLSTLPPEQRVAGLAPEDLVLGLPDEKLRLLGDDFLASLSDAARAAIRKRIGH